MTGHGSAEDSEVGRRLGAVAYLQKPVDLEDLLATIEQTEGANSAEKPDER
jgi:DNA-binding response OmpR family regulator